MCSCKYTFLNQTAILMRPFFFYDPESDLSKSSVVHAPNRKGIRVFRRSSASEDIRRKLCVGSM